MSPGPRATRPLAHHLLMSVTIDCDGCGAKLGELRGGTLNNRVVSELTKVDGPIFGAGIPGDFRVNHLCQGCTAAVVRFLNERRNHIPHPDCDRFTPEPAPSANPGPCADPGCPVLHDDPANPVHPPGYVAPQAIGRNFGHGWVWARPDGVKVRCGGPAICSKCARDQTALQMGNAMAAEQAKGNAPEPTSPPPGTSGVSLGPDGGR